MKTREQYMKEKQVIFNPKNKVETIRSIAQTLGIANTTIRCALKKKDITGVLSKYIK